MNPLSHIGQLLPRDVQMVPLPRPTDDVQSIPLADLQKLAPGQAVAPAQNRFDNLAEGHRLACAGRAREQQMQRLQPRRNRRVGHEDLSLPRLARAVLQAAMTDHARAAQEAAERRAAELAVIPAHNPVTDEESGECAGYQGAYQNVVVGSELRDLDQPAKHGPIESITPRRR